MEKAVILARGLGTRMRKADNNAQVNSKQAIIAETGVKAMIPIDRPFLDYVLHSLAEAGYQKICLIIGPEHGQVREYYGNELKYNRIEVDFGVQVEPLGTADAVSAAEAFAGDDPFLVINSDNYYPMEALRSLRELEGPGLAAFERDSMVAGGNIVAEQVTKFAVVETDDEGYMTRIIEKPDEKTLATLPEPIGVSMNCWRFDASIFTACRSISPSARGEMELPDAVEYTMKSMGCRYCALMVKAPVLDMSSRSDIASVTEKLAGSEVNL